MKKIIKVLKVILIILICAFVGYFVASELIRNVEDIEHEKVIEEKFNSKFINP